MNSLKLYYLRQVWLWKHLSYYHCNGIKNWNFMISMKLYCLWKSLSLILICNAIKNWTFMIITLKLYCLWLDMFSLVLIMTFKIDLFKFYKRPKFTKQVESLSSRRCSNLRFSPWWSVPSLTYWIIDFFSVMKLMDWT